MIKRNERNSWKTWTKEELETIKKLARAGMSYRVIGEKLGRTRYAVAGRVRDLRKQGKWDLD